MGTLNVEDGSGFAAGMGRDETAGRRTPPSNPPSGPATPGAGGGVAGVGADSTAGMRGLAGAGSVDGAQPEGMGPGSRGGASAVPMDTHNSGPYADARGKNTG